MMTKAKIYYHDIGDYRSREEKLAIIKKNRSIAHLQKVGCIMINHLLKVPDFGRKFSQQKSIKIW
jgi:hypothetical protein